MNHFPVVVNIFKYSPFHDRSRGKWTGVQANNVSTTSHLVGDQSFVCWGQHWASANTHKDRKPKLSVLRRIEPRLYNRHWISFKYLFRNTSRSCSIAFAQNFIYSKNLLIWNVIRWHNVLKHEWPQLQVTRLHAIFFFFIYIPRGLSGFFGFGTITS